MEGRVEWKVEVEVEMNVGRRGSSECVYYRYGKEKKKFRVSQVRADFWVLDSVFAKGRGLGQM